MKWRAYLVGPATVVAEAVGRLGDVEAARERVGLAVVQGLDRGNLVRVGVDEVRKLLEELAALVPGDLLAPDGVERELSGVAG